MGHGGRLILIGDMVLFGAWWEYPDRGNGAVWALWEDDTDRGKGAVWGIVG
jgi:hypothetical protein